MRVPFRLVAAMLIALAGCDFPNDAEGTLQRVRAEGVLRVGYSERPPWVMATGDEAVGIEPQLVRRWAAELGARVQWVRGSESSLLHALEERRIDLMIGGITRDSPWTRRAGATQPFLDAQVVVAVPADLEGLHSRSDWAGQRISHAASRPDFSAIIAAADALPDAAEQVGDRPSAVYTFEAADMGLVVTPAVLRRERHVMLVPPGESATLFALDRFLATARRQGLVTGTDER